MNTTTIPGVRLNGASGPSLEERMDQMAKELKASREELRYSRGPNVNYSSAAKLVHTHRPKPLSQAQEKVCPSNLDFFKGVKEVGESGDGAMLSHKTIGPWLKASVPDGATMNETVLADGGALVPPETAHQILMRLYDYDSFLGKLSLFPTTGNNMSFPAINETTHADGSLYGGVKAYWRSEAAAVSLTKPNLDLINLKLNSLMCNVEATDELLEDNGFALESWLTTAATQALAFRMGAAIFSGDGNTKPEGFLNSPSVIKVAKDSGQTTGTITPTNISNMFSRLHPLHHKNSMWACSPSVLPALFTMTLGSAGAVTQLGVFMPPGGMSAKPYSTILGLPLEVTEFCQPLGTPGDLVLFDPASIVGITKGGVNSAVSLHVKFLTNQSVFRFIMRVDAQSWVRTPLTPLNSGPTLSNIITLAAR